MKSNRIRAEREVEDLARTVMCPVCCAKPRVKCKDDLHSGPMDYSHQGRLRAARTKADTCASG